MNDSVFQTYPFYIERFHPHSLRNAFSLTQYLEGLEMSSMACLTSSLIRP